jgi:N-acyl-D-amino-acid deacylase
VAKIGRIGSGEAAEVVKAEGLVVTPGFVDIHTHSDLNLLACPTADNSVGQGVTTEVVGNCGFAPAPYRSGASEQVTLGARDLGLDVTWRSFGGYLKALARSRPAVNVVPLAGHGELRAAAMGYEARPAERGELEEMEAHLEEALGSGAFGLSSGLIYPPSCYAPPEELASLARLVARAGGIYASHIRGEGATLVEAVQEALETAREARVTLEISHHKATGRRNWGKTRATLALVEEAHRDGMAVGMDLYPYTATSTGLSALLPPSIQEGGVKAMVERLQDRDYRREVTRTIRRDLDSWENTAGEAGWEAVVFSSSSTGRNRRLQGLTLRQIARRRGREPEEALYDLLVEEEGQGDIIVHELSEGDIRRVYRHPLTVVGSDGWTSSRKGVLGPKGVHPRAWGTFPRFLSRYGGGALMSTAEAIHRATGLPAQRLGLVDRGLVKEGFRADLVVLDPRCLRDAATYERPKVPGEGIRMVLVNGEVVARRGRPTGSRPGKVLRRPNSRPGGG